jgi:SprT protein
MPSQKIPRAGNLRMPVKTNAAAIQSRLAMTTPPVIDTQQRALVMAATVDYTQRGERLFERQFDRIPVVFDLRGRAAGMYRVKGLGLEIRYNPFIFARYFDDCLRRTVPHEVAHYLCHQVYGWATGRPHGSEWQRLMQLFGADARRTHSYDLEGLPMRTANRYNYRCDCRNHQLGSRRHSRVRRGEAIYRCCQCGCALTFAS